MFTIRALVIALAPIFVIFVAASLYKIKESNYLLFSLLKNTCSYPLNACNSPQSFKFQLSLQVFGYYDSSFITHRIVTKAEKG